MPPGWEPPPDVTFKPREESPEVAADFWPASQRSPLASVSDGGMFRWSQAAIASNRIRDMCKPAQ